jgi:hypothetical protein
MMLENVRTMATALGGRADALRSIDAADILICLAAGLTVAPDEAVKAVGLVMPRRSNGHYALWQCVILPQHSSLTYISAIASVLPQLFAQSYQFAMMPAF